ncbi:MAG: alpha/beta hydrolase [Anaerolineales bacterium]
MAHGHWRHALPEEQFGDVRLHFETDGELTAGTPVVLLHGLGSCAEDWILQRAALTGRWPLLLIDLRGHGRSAPIRRTFTIGEMAADVAGLMERLRIESAYFVGLSLGATVALQIGIDRPDLVRSLTLANGFAHLSISPAGWIGALGRLALFLTGRMDWLGRWIAGLLFPSPDQDMLRRQAAERIGANDWASYGLTMLALRQFDARPSMASITAPTLIVVGENDPVVPSSAKEAMHRGIRGSQLVTVLGSGHATPLDAPDQFNHELIHFLRKVEGQPSRSVSPESNGPPAGGPVPA